MIFCVSERVCSCSSCLSSSFCSVLSLSAIVVESVWFSLFCALIFSFRGSSFASYSSMFSLASIRSSSRSLVFSTWYFSAFLTCVLRFLTFFDTSERTSSTRSRSLAVISSCLNVCFLRCLYRVIPAASSSSRRRSSLLLLIISSIIFSSITE